jgi:hypothetical protein
LRSYSDNPEDRYNIENGTTLCVFHHEDFHAKYGKGGNTEEQFDEYSLICEALVRAASHNYKVERYTKDAIRLLDGYQIATKLLEDLDQDGYYGRFL